MTEPDLQQVESRQQKTRVARRVLQLVMTAPVALDMAYTMMTVTITRTLMPPMLTMKRMEW